MILCVIWVVLMMFWLFGGGYYTSTQPNPNWMGWGASSLIPWVCVLILGLIAVVAIAALTLLGTAITGQLGGLSGALGGGGSA